MRRIFLILMCLCLVPLPAQAQQPTKYVVLSFDDGPSGRFTRRLLDGLAQRDVKATFLLCGYRLKDYPKEAQRIADEGHEIGIHGYSHNSMCGMGPSCVAREILDTAALLPQGVNPVFLRPPGGKCGGAMYEMARQQGLAVLNWSLDTKDWTVKNAATITDTVLQNVRDGDVILMHDMYDSSVDAALAIIDALTARGYQFITASQLAQLRGYSLRPGEVYCRFPEF